MLVHLESLVKPGLFASAAAMRPHNVPDAPFYGALTLHVGSSSHCEPMQRVCKQVLEKKGPSYKKPTAGPELMLT